MRHLTKKLILTLASSFATPMLMTSLATADAETRVTNHCAKAPLLEGMGSWTRPISTRNQLAQRYFDQGLTLAYGFNHAEAERSFLEAARLDPSCAMCFWGAALVLGPNINARMNDADVPRAFAHLQRALALAHLTTPRHQALIEALATRYAPRPVADRSSLDKAYAEAMRAVAKRFPNDVDILALQAEAQMDLHPWNYWAEDGSPRADTPEILATLERAMQLVSDHPGALHYYIHLVEASPHPERALGAADKLAFLVPGAGHLVHMPAHIYMRTGRYHEASQANIRAIEADERYLPQADPNNPYLHLYRLHNPQFLWAAATLEGRSHLAIHSARMTAKMALGIEHAVHGSGMELMLEHFLASPIYALVRFGHWQQILVEPQPSHDQVYLRAVWHYARAIAHSRLGRHDVAVDELHALERLATTPSLAMTVSGVNTASSVLAVAVQVTKGELAADRGDLEAAIGHLRLAGGLEDQLRYMEPPDWHHPTRQILGKLLLRAGENHEAEQVYREDLAKLPENGYSLFGLAVALERQGKHGEAAKVWRRYAVAFARADVKLGD